MLQSPVAEGHVLHSSFQLSLRGEIELQGLVETEEKINNHAEVLAKLPVAFRGPAEPHPLGTPALPSSLFHFLCFLEQLSSILTAFLIKN